MDGQQLDIEMEPAGNANPDLEGQVCKWPFRSFAKHARHEATQHPDRKRADQTIVFNPMKFHELVKSLNKNVSNDGAQRIHSPARSSAESSMQRLSLCSHETVDLKKQKE